jgi:hypothetical protein
MASSHEAPISRKACEVFDLREGLPCCVSQFLALRYRDVIERTFIAVQSRARFKAPDWADTQAVRAQVASMLRGSE